MEKEEIIINLKLLEKVQKNQKLVTRDSYLNIESESLVPECIRRWKRHDNRDESVKKINSIINAAILNLQQQPSDIMKEYITKSATGIINLKETYSMCHQTCARLDMILDKIKEYKN
jgi:hypothetical protein